MSVKHLLPLGPPAYTKTSTAEPAALDLAPIYLDIPMRVSFACNGLNRMRDLRDSLGEEPGALIRVRGSADGKSRLNQGGSLSATPMVCCSNRPCLTRRWMRRKTTRRKLTPNLMIAVVVGPAVPWNSWPISHSWRSG